MLCIYDPDGGINDRVTAAQMALVPTKRTHSEIAQRMGMTRSYLCHLLKGRRKWTEKLAKQFMEAI